MAETPLEVQLREFLRREEEVHRGGKTVEALHEKQDKLYTAVRRVARQQLVTEESLKRHDRAIRTLQHQVGLLTNASPGVSPWAAPPEETPTGSYKRIEDLEHRLDAEADREREETTWWRRQRWLWIGIFGATVFSATLTGCVGYITYRIQNIEKTLSAPR